MRGVATIFGGMRTTRAHYRRAIETYEAEGLQVHFFEAELGGLGTMLPARFARTVASAQRAHQEHISTLACRIGLTTALNVKHRSVVHANSGGFWSALQFARSVPAAGFVLEAGPLDATAPLQMLQALSRNYLGGLSLPADAWRAPATRELTRRACASAGVPHCENPESAGWYAQYRLDVARLRESRVLILRGDRDGIVDPVFARDFRAQLERGVLEILGEHAFSPSAKDMRPHVGSVREIIVPGAGHHNVAKIGGETYSAALADLVRSL